MDSQAHGARLRRCALIPLFSLVLGCAPGVTMQPVAPAPIGPVIAHGGGDVGHVSLEAVPSPEAAELLPADARYRAVLGADGELALVIVGGDRRILGRLHVESEIPARAIAGTRIRYEGREGDAARIEAWSFAGAIDGRAAVGDQSARFRVRLEADGELAAERWSLAHHRASTELLELRRARAITADLAALTTELARAGEVSEHQRCLLAEQLALAELALELSVRAWAGEDRARLPAVAEYVRPGCACGL